MPVMQAPNGARDGDLADPAVHAAHDAAAPGAARRRAVVAQPVGIAGVIVWTVAGTWAAARIFRVAILMQGQAPKLRDLLRWAFAG
jgi:hypothetical protein